MDKDENKKYNKAENSNEKYMIIKHKLSKKIIILLSILAIILLIIFKILDLNTNTAVLEFNIEDKNSLFIVDSENTISEFDNGSITDI